MSCRIASFVAAFILAGLGQARAEEVISTNRCSVNGIRGEVTVEIVMTRGQLSDDTELWCGAGRKWQGEFEIRVRTKRRLLSRTPLEGFFDFYAPKFKLVMRDYNGDGRIDFNLGQYGACMYNDYWIFTIQRDGSVSKLPVEGPPGNGAFSLSGTGHANSTPDLTVRRGRVRCTYYDRETLPFGYVTEQWEWKRDRFVLVTTKPATDSEWPPKSWRLASGTSH